MRDVFNDLNEFQSSIIFEEIEDSSINSQGQQGGIIRIGYYELIGSPACAFAFFPGNESASPNVGDIWFNAQCDGGNWGDESQEKLILIHELGHVLGFKHNYRTNSPEFPILPIANGNHSLSVMYTPRRAARWSVSPNIRPLRHGGNPQPIWKELHDPIW